MGSNLHSIKILLVEDNEGHAVLIKDNLREGRIANEIIDARDGQEALDYLFRVGKYENLKGTPLPGLILLDINLPRVDGYGVLQQLKADERLKHIPVIMLTSTDDPTEVSRCYNLGAASYITKPVPYDALQERVRTLGLFLEIVTLPSL